MAEPLDFDALIAPIPGDNPSGQELPYDVRSELDESRKEPDPLEPSTADRRADWKGIIRLGKQTLTETSKDLLVGVRILEAMVKEASESRDPKAPTAFAQMRDGFKLLRLLCENCWDYLLPMPEPGDEGMEAREGPFKWINDSGRGARFPSTILNIPLFIRRGEGEPFNYFFYKDANRQADFDEGLRTADGKKIKEMYDDLQAAKEELASLNAVLDTKMGHASPGMTSEDSPDNIGQALQQYNEALESLMKKKGISTSGDAAEEGGSESSSEEGGGDDGAGGGTISVGRTNRAGLYRQLEQIAGALQSIEPHSPIPYLLQRCVRLGALSFPDLMKAIVRETTALDEIDRLLGIGAGAEAPPSE